MQLSADEVAQQQETTQDTRQWSGPPAQADTNPGTDLLPPVSRAFFENVLRLNLFPSTSAGEFLRQNASRLAELNSAEELGEALIQAGLLTRYQVDRIMAGTTYGLVLGNYRVLSRLGAGGMGIVFLGEHMLMRRKVAIKVLPVDDDCPSVALDRFYGEMRVLAQLQHPNIVLAYDSGQVDPLPGFPVLVYLVMELVDGCDLEQYVQRHGPVSIGKACNWIRQAAGGLQEAHNHSLIHRDVKPSNLLLTTTEQIKLVDFGLVRQLSIRLTDPTAVLGTVDYMPPEQSADPTSVGTHADIYSLGATLFWLLAGHLPYPPARSVREALRQLQQDPPRRLRAFRPDAPPELEALLARLLDRDPLRRPALALTVMKLLEPFADK